MKPLTPLSNPFGLGVLVLALFATACSPLPSEQLSQYTLGREAVFASDSLTFVLSNPVADSLFSRHNPIIIRPFQDTTVVFTAMDRSAAQGISVRSFLGDPDAPVRSPVLALPYPPHRSYAVLQGYEGTFSHTSDYSRYAMDFDLAVGDTVAAAEAGYVVGVVEGYRKGGRSQKWRDFANFITLYHPDSGVFTQYVHLMENGSLVALGDTVHSGQPIDAFKTPRPPSEP